MLTVKIGRDEPTELFEQAAAQIRRAIADGEAKPGERLPQPAIWRPCSA
jgi:GntR family transcriptional regulator